LTFDPKESIIQRILNGNKERQYGIRC
jgi:hypothetical protein